MVTIGFSVAGAGFDSTAAGVGSDLCEVSTLATAAGESSTTVAAFGAPFPKDGQSPTFEKSLAWKFDEKNKRLWIRLYFDSVFDFLSHIYQLNCEPLNDIFSLDDSHDASDEFRQLTRRFINSAIRRVSALTLRRIINFPQHTRSLLT